MFAREMNGIVAIEARGAKILRVRNDLLHSFKAQIRKRIGGNIFFDLIYEMGGGDQFPPCWSVNAIKAGTDGRRRAYFEVDLFCASAFSEHLDDLFARCASHNRIIDND
jgi:hypothetical protein